MDNPDAGAGPRSSDSGGRPGWGGRVAWVLGSCDAVGAGVNLALALGCVALRARHAQLGPNRQGLIFSLIVEAGRVVDANGLGGVVGAPHRRPIALAFTNLDFVDRYLTGLALFLAGWAAVGLVLGYGLRHLRGWARWGQMALAAGLAALVGTSCVLADGADGWPGVAAAAGGALLVVGLLGSRPVARAFAPGEWPAGTAPRAARPRFALVALVAVLALAPVLSLWVAWGTIQWALTIRQIAG